MFKPFYIHSSEIFYLILFYKTKSLKMNFVSLSFNIFQLFYASSDTRQNRKVNFNDIISFFGKFSPY